jgi:two-component system OmpR family sensor kinase
MRLRPRSLRGRLGLSLGLALTLLWIAAASITAVVVRHELDEVFDATLEETAQRILPLAGVDIVGREDEGVTQRLAAIRSHEEFYTYIVRDAQGRILLQSHAADPAAFPAYDGPGFRDTATHRFYNDDALKGTVRISVAEPLAHRKAVARQIQMALGLPLLVVIPAALLAIVLAVGGSLAAIGRFSDRLTARNARDLAPVPVRGLPSELLPLAGTLNALLDRLRAAFEAERSFAANVAHELRTPLAGAIAQAQRIGTEATLKRLARVCERLLQLARAEGGPLRLDRAADLRPVARIVVEDIGRTLPPDRLRLSLPDRPVVSDLDPDAFAILCRNLVENALRHGAASAPVAVTLAEDGTFAVANAGPAVPAATLGRLTARFERGGSATDGSGLGLAIVAAIAERIGSPLVLRSPLPGQDAGFEASVRLPVQSGGQAAQRAPQVSDRR